MGGCQGIAMWWLGDLLGCCLLTQVSRLVHTDVFFNVKVSRMFYSPAGENTNRLCAHTHTYTNWRHSIGIMVLYCANSIF